MFVLCSIYEETITLRKILQCICLIGSNYIFQLVDQQSSKVVKNYVGKHKKFSNFLMILGNCFDPMDSKMIWKIFGV